MFNFQVLRVVKTRQVTYSVLNHLIDYIKNCEKIGLLEEKEMQHLHDAVQVHSVMMCCLLSIFFRFWVNFLLIFLNQKFCFNSHAD